MHISYQYRCRTAFCVERPDSRNISIEQHVLQTCAVLPTLYPTKTMKMYLGTGRQGTIVAAMATGEALKAPPIIPTPRNNFFHKPHLAGLKFHRLSITADKSVPSRTPRSSTPAAIDHTLQDRLETRVTMSDDNDKQMNDKEVAAEFTSYYLQRATKEFAEDLDKIRNADDFRNDAIPLLVNALSQGTAMFPPADQRRIVTAEDSVKKLQG